MTKGPTYDEAVLKKPALGWNQETDAKRARKVIANAGDIFNDSGIEEECFGKLYRLAIDPDYASEMLDAHWPELRQDLRLRREMRRRLLNYYFQQTERPGTDACGDEFESSEEGTYRDPTIHTVGGLETQMMNQVASKRLEWLWPQRFPLGKVSLLAGFPDQGKSLITLNMAATISTGGAWPNNEGNAEKGVVIILSAEDTADDTMKPRLMAAGADLTKIMTIKPMVRDLTKGVKTKRVFNVADDLVHLTKVIQEFEAKGETVRMVIFDPLNAYFGGKSKVDSHNTSEMRALLTPISEWCSKRGVAVVGIMHFNKGDNSHALYRITGSNAIGAVARAAWITVEDPETKKTMMLRGKANLAKKDDKSGLAYSIEDREIDDPEFDGDSIPFIKWGEAVDVSANEALKPPTREREAEAVNTAIRYLQESFEHWGPMTGKQLEETRKAALVSEMTFRRAKEQLGVVHVHPKKVGAAHLFQLPKADEFFFDDNKFEGVEDIDPDFG